MNKLQIALALARGEQPRMEVPGLDIGVPYALLTKADTASIKVCTVFLTEDSGDGELETAPFQFVYATRELAKKAIEEHVRACRTEDFSNPEVTWVEGVCSVRWLSTGAWAELRIDEVTLVAGDAATE